MPSPNLCVSILGCLYDFQTLLSGGIAVLGAVATALVIWKAARLPVVKQDEVSRKREQMRLNYVSSVLNTEFTRLSNRALQAASTITVFKAANASITEETKKKTRLAMPTVVADWESMSLLPAGLLDQIMRLRNDVENHNFDVDRAGGAFGDNNFSNQMKTRLGHIETTSQALANQAVARK
jgi:hypothetical protein